MAAQPTGRERSENSPVCDPENQGKLQQIAGYFGGGGEASDHAKVRDVEIESGFTMIELAW